MATDPLYTKSVTRLLYIGNSILQVLYGVFLTLTVICLRYLLIARENTPNKPLHRHRHNLCRPRNWVSLAYTIASFFATTAILVGSVKHGEIVLLNQSQSISRSVTTPVVNWNILQTAASLVQVWLADGLLIYRLWIVWSKRYPIIVLPCMLFLGSIASGIAGITLFSQNPFARAIRIGQFSPSTFSGILFQSCSIALNIIATTFIAGRLLHHSRIASNLFVVSASNGSGNGSGNGDPDFGKQYLSLTAIFAESGALYTLSAIAFIPTFALDHPLSLIFSVFFVISAAIAPMLILLRAVLCGSGFEQQRSKQPPIHWQPSSPGPSRSSRPSSATVVGSLLPPLQFADSGAPDLEIEEAVVDRYKSVPPGTDATTRL